MTITHNIKIPFHLCDPAKILFFGSLYEVYHQFLEDHISEFGVDWNDWFKGPTGAPIRALNTSYDAPLFFGETYEGKWSVIKVSESTVSFKFSIGTSNKDHAITEITHCFINPKDGSKTEIPSKIKSALLKHL